MDTKIEVSKNITFNNNSRVYSGYYKETLLAPDQTNSDLSSDLLFEWTGISGTIPFVPKETWIYGTLSHSATGANEFIVLKKLYFALSNLKMDGDFSNNGVMDIKDADIWSLTRYERNENTYDDYDPIYDFGGGLLYTTTTANTNISINFAFNLATQYGGWWNNPTNVIIPDGFNVRMTIRNQNYHGNNNIAAATTVLPLTALKITNLRLSLLTQLDQSIIKEMNMKISQSMLVYPFDTISQYSQTFQSGATLLTINQKLVPTQIGSKLKEIYILVLESDAIFKGASNVLVNFVPTSDTLFNKITNIKVTLGNDVLFDKDISKGQYKFKNKCKIPFFQDGKFSSPIVADRGKYLDFSDICCIKVPIVLDTDDTGEKIIGKDLLGTENIQIDVNLSSANDGSRVFAYFVGSKKMVVSSLGTQVTL